MVEFRIMEDSVSTTELDKALTELDGMYNDLSATLKRQKKADAESAENAAVNTSSTSANPGSDDYDYDIPRPAGGRDNNAVMKYIYLMNYRIYLTVGLLFIFFYLKNKILQKKLD